MSKEQITMEGLRGGEYLKSINEAIQRAVSHVVSRPEIEKPRTVTAKLSIIPRLEYLDGAMAPVNMPVIGFQVDVKIPGTKGIETRGIVKPDPETGEMVVLVDSENPNQYQTPLFDKKENVHELKPEKTG